MTIKDLKEGQSATICTVGGDGALRQHFLDMGVIPGIEVKLIKYAPMGDPLEIRIHDYELTLRLMLSRSRYQIKNQMKTNIGKITERIKL